MDTSNSAVATKVEVELDQIDKHIRNEIAASSKTVRDGADVVIWGKLATRSKGESRYVGIGVQCAILEHHNTRGSERRTVLGYANCWVGCARLELWIADGFCAVG